MRVTHRTLIYEIGETPRDDSATDTWDIEAVDGRRGVLWWLLAVGGSGEGVPPKSKIWQLERLEAEEFLEGGQGSGVPVLHLDHRDGKIWAIAIFSEEAAHQRLRVRWSWAGIWNPLRITMYDRSALDLRELQNVEWESVTVQFAFSRAALRPEVRVAEGGRQAPSVSEDAFGRVVYMFQLDRPALKNYSWEMRVQGFAPEDHVAPGI
jgi:hypothetical protein